MNPDLAKQVLKYLAGGLTTTILTWSCVWLFVEIFLFHYLISINLATICAYGYSYLVNKLFVFGDKKGGHIVKGSKFLTLQVSLLITTNLFMYVTVSLLSFHYMISVVVISIINAAISFLLMRTNIFAQHK
jgi:putative flippase GtrA